MTDKGHQVCVSTSGLVVNPRNPWRGCTPDAKIIFDGKCGIGESKCPYDYRNDDLRDVAKSNNQFYLKVVGDLLHLKLDHPYYFQVKCQLALTGASFCDFIVYKFRSLAIHRGTFHRSFWEEVMAKVNKYQRASQDVDW